MTHFLAEIYAPWSQLVIVRAMNGRECVTAAPSSDPWWAAWKCCGFMLNRFHTADAARRTAGRVQCPA